MGGSAPDRAGAESAGVTPSGPDRDADAGEKPPGNGPDMKQRRKLLNSIPGIGEKTAAVRGARRADAETA